MNANQALPIIYLNLRACQRIGRDLAHPELQDRLAAILAAASVLEDHIETIEHQAKALAQLLAPKPLAPKGS